MSTTYVVTTIHEPSDGLATIAKRASQLGDRVIVIGDRKTPANWGLAGVDYFSFDAQASLPFSLRQHLPSNSYTRKMLGYLAAAQGGCKWIRETDDDNLPYETFFEPPPEAVSCRVPSGHMGWVNIYKYFTQRHVWPRGFPLSLINAKSLPMSNDSSCVINQPYILQALADGDPDVDAIYRLTSLDDEGVTFLPAQSLALTGANWTPFNSQATTWPRELIPLMYLPISCSFRMTDIWRSFVAQRLLPGLGASLIVSSAKVSQIRNAHDLLADFAQEVPGYLEADRFRSILENTPTLGGFSNVSRDLKSLYTALISAGFLSRDEMSVLDAWLQDVQLLGLVPEE